MKPTVPPNTEPAKAVAPPTVNPLNELNAYNRNTQDNALSKRDTIAMHFMAGMIQHDAMEMAAVLADRSVILAEALMERLRRHT